MLRHPLLLLLLVALPLAAGCDPAPTPPPAAKTYVGTLAGGASGALRVTIEGATATGEMTILAKTGSQPSLSGSFNATTGALTLSGGGYTFTGTLSGTTLSGTWTGPNGTAGSFTSTLDGSGPTAVVVYCGTYDGTVEDGTLNIVRTDTSLLGLAVAHGASSGSSFAGTVSGNAVTVWLSGDPQQTPVATGTISGSTITGQFSGGSNSGTWQASVCTP